MINMIKNYPNFMFMYIRIFFFVLSRSIKYFHNSFNKALTEYSWRNQDFISFYNSTMFERQFFAYNNDADDDYYIYKTGQGDNFEHVKDALL